MFECRACVLRCIRAITGDAFKSNPITRTQLLLIPRLSPQTFRRHASTAIAAKKSQDDELVPGKQPVADKNGVEKGSGKRQTSVAVRDEKALKIELKWLSDPVKLAEHVHYTLRNNKPDKALDLCRLASKKQEVIVSWNHVVDWYMSKGKVDDALKVYNEMKKRAQFPDAYTYTILLRGLSKTDRHEQIIKEANVAKAVTIYNSMSSPTSRTKPTIYHTNAVLKVCSAALDMDALWGIVSKLPSSGSSAPDHVTYAILLTAIRHGAFGKNPEETLVEQLGVRRNKAVQEGRGVWRDIIKKWRAGDVKIDEELVCAMGRLLLMSSHMQDWDDVLSLVQQTMQIERLVPPLGSPGRNVEHVPQDNDFRNPSAEGEEGEDNTDGYTDTPATKAFLPIQPFPRDSAYPTRPTSLAYVHPGNPTLSLLIGACTLLRVPKTASAYWNHLTSSDSLFQIKPDIANFHAYLRLLGKNRSSAQAVRLVCHAMPDAGVEPKNQTFRIAMSVCVRDKNNPHTLEHAREIVDLMEKTAADVDVHTLIQYLSLALSTDDGVKIGGVLDRLDPIVHNLRSRVVYGADSASHQPTPEAHLTDKEQTITFFQTIVGVIDTLLNRGMVPRESFTHWHGRRSQLQQFIGRAKNNLENQRARLQHDQHGRKGDATEKGTKLMGRSEYRSATRKPEWRRVGHEYGEVGFIRKHESGSPDDTLVGAAAKVTTRGIGEEKEARGEGKEGWAEGKVMGQMEAALKNFRRREKASKTWRTGVEVAGRGGWGGRDVEGRRGMRKEEARVVDVGVGFADSPAELDVR